MEDMHYFDCNCLECLHPYQGNHVDQGFGENDEKLAYYLDSTLIAKKPIKVWSLPGASMPGAKVKRVVKTGDKVGVVDSWVKDKKGTGNWFMLKDRGGYVVASQSLYNMDVAKLTSSGKKYVDTQKEIWKEKPFFEPSKNLLTNLFGNFKLIIIAAGLAILTAVFLRIKG